MGIYLATCAIQALPQGEDGKPPKRVCLVPAPVDGKIEGKDGRSWAYTDPSKILAAIKSRGNPVTIDENHAHELAKTTGCPSPALARVPVDTVSLGDDGSIWGEPEWTTYGQERHAQGAYLGLSPAFLYDASTAANGSQGDMIGLSSAGLVNEPNLDLPVALNSVQHNPQGEKYMDPKEIRALLGLDENATDVEVKAAMSALSAPVVTPAPVAAVAPNATEEPPAWAVALNAEVASLKTALANKSAESHKVAVNAAIERFISAGKILPSPEARAYAEAQCGTETALNAFVAYHESAPKLVPGDVALNGVEPPKGPAKLTETQQMLKTASGLSDEDFNRGYKD